MVIYHKKEATKAKSGSEFAVKCFTNVYLFIFSNLLMLCFFSVTNGSDKVMDSRGLQMCVGVQGDLVWSDLTQNS